MRCRPTRCMSATCCSYALSADTCSFPTSTEPDGAVHLGAPRFQGWSGGCFRRRQHGSRWQHDGRWHVGWRQHGRRRWRLDGRWGERKHERCVTCWVPGGWAPWVHRHGRGDDGVLIHLQENMHVVSFLQTMSFCVYLRVVTATWSCELRCGWCACRALR